MTPQNSPTKNPPATSFNVCWRTMMRAEPSMPASRMKAQSHPVGLNWKIKLYESNPPTIMPLLAVWVLIFHLMLISAPE